MTKAALVARLKKEYAAEDYFTGVLGNRASVVLPHCRGPISATIRLRFRAA